MMKYLIAGLFLLCTGSSLYSQVTITLPVVFKDTAPLGQEFLLTFGVDSRASDCVDTALDERDLPPPPPGFLPVITPGCLDTNAGTTITLHKDYRAIPPDSLTFSKTYHCVIYRGENRLPINLRWNSNLAAGIDSAALMIEFVDTVDMRSQSEYVVNNEFVTALDIKIYYHLETVDVRENGVADNIHLFPIPAEDHVSVQAKGYQGGRYELYSVDGNRILVGTIEHEEFMLYTENLSAGIYLFRLYDNKGESRVLRLVRQ